MGALFLFVYFLNLATNLLIRGANAQPTNTPPQNKNDVTMLNT